MTKRAVESAAPTAEGVLPIAARRHPLVAELARQLGHCGLPLERDNGHQADSNRQVKLVIGISGGADSVALLLGSIVLSARHRENGASLIPVAAHVHHHLRDSADDDAAFVRELCDRFGVELHVEHVRPGELDGNLAANARLLRYEALMKVAHRVGAAFVAVAHHGDDQLETMLMTLGRGAGIDGMSGMTWCRPLWQDIMLIRPLLAATKADCEDFCRNAGVQWREDPSNSDVQRVRARLRRDVVPVLRELWPDICRRVSATAEVLEAARHSLERVIEDFFGPAGQRQWPRRELAGLSIPVIASGLRRAALDAAPGVADQLNQRHLLQAASAIRSHDHRPHRYHWPGGLELKITTREVSLLNDDGGVDELMDRLQEADSGRCDLPPARRKRAADGGSNHRPAIRDSEHG